MPIPQQALSLGLSAMRRLNSAWGSLALQKVIVVSIAVMTVVAAWMNPFDAFAVLVLPCAMLLLLIWGLSELFRLLGLSKWSENIRVAVPLAVVVGFFLGFGFMVSREARRVFRHNAELSAKMQEVRSERNKLRIGMTINDVLPLVHGMDIKADAESVWLSVLPDNKPFYYWPGSLWLKQQDDGTFTFLCICRTEQVSRNAKVTESQAAALMMRAWVEPEQVLQNLSESRAAALMKQKMSGGYEWHCTLFTFDKWPWLEASFTVTFGLDGRVKDITEVSTTDLSSHRA